MAWPISIQGPRHLPSTRGLQGEGNGGGLELDSFIPTKLTKLADVGHLARHDSLIESPFKFKDILGSVKVKKHLGHKKLLTSAFLEFIDFLFGSILPRGVRLSNLLLVGMSWESLHPCTLPGWDT